MHEQVSHFQKGTLGCLATKVPQVSSKFPSSCGCQRKFFGYLIPGGNASVDYYQNINSYPPTTLYEKITINIY